ncbi:MAG: Acyl-CoA synthetase (AMP-forming)/AMP-acid ligase [Anaerocolumna sp.]|jgi:acyl-coenzyme A synthetase/AMP-(fatty) acid ligase|nr:Acyl-CoA synthetase (AMP-forming)/AMP-acid ligase [Anaerocolumna sp.]
MKSLEIILKRMEDNPELPALYWKEEEFNYSNLIKMIEDWEILLEDKNIEAGDICGVVGEFSPMVCSLFFALMKRKSIIVPFTKEIQSEIPAFLEIAEVKWLFRFDEKDEWMIEKPNYTVTNDLIVKFRERESSGLIVFSSGSTGKPKGILHDCDKVLNKFTKQRNGWRTVLFLMMDHFGGFNTFLSTFAYLGVGVCIEQRTPENICKVIEKSKATLLPTTPTFLNLLIASKSYYNYDLSSIDLITYGTEMMNESTLEYTRKIFSNAQIKQTYGLSEVGVLRSKSEDDGSLWVKVGGGGFETKIVDNVLWIRSEANMVGYLNAQNPFDEDGWLCTGDEVEVKGDYVRFVGRKSEIINVGGQKVFPSEIESVLLQADNIKEAAVFGASHPIMGQVVQAKVSLYHDEDVLALTQRLRKHCMERLAKYKIPIRFIVVDQEEQHSVRFKKLR